MEKVIDDFRGRYFFLSNDFPAEVYYGNDSYKSVTHALLTLSVDKITIKKNIAKQKYPSYAYKIFRNYGGRKRYEYCVESFLERLIEQKFANNRELYNKLLSTGCAELVYNKKNDTVLGGKINILGKTLMKIREKFRRERQI